MAEWGQLTPVDESPEGTRDDQDLLMSGPAGAVTTLLPPAEWMGDPPEEPDELDDELPADDDTLDPAGPEFADHYATSVVEESALATFEEALHPRDRGGKFAFKGVSSEAAAKRMAKAADPGDFMSGRHADSLTVHTRGGQLSSEREALHHRIIQHFLAGTHPQQHPQALFTAGGAASGKTSLIENLPTAHGHVMVNPDLIKEMLPEYKHLQDAGRSDIAAAATHEESSHLAAQIAHAATSTHRHVIIDGVGDSGNGKFAGKLTAARDAGHQVTVRYAHVPVEEALRRDAKRAQRTGRDVPDDVLVHAHQQVAQRYHEEIRHVKGIRTEVYSTESRELGPVLIAHHDPMGELHVHDEAKYQAFQDKRHPAETSVSEAAFEEVLHPRGRTGEFASKGGAGKFLRRGALIKLAGEEGLFKLGQRQGQHGYVYPHGAKIHPGTGWPEDKAQVRKVKMADVTEAEPAGETVEPKAWQAPPPPVGKSGERKGAGGYSSDKAYGTNTELGRAGEEAFTRILGGKILHPEGKGEQSPLDVRYDGYGFEVKAVSTKTLGYKATPKPFEIDQKQAFAQELGVKPALAIVVVDSDAGQAHAYYRDGLNGGRLSQGTGWKYLGSAKL